MDPYKVLEIEKNAKDNEIKKAYHKLARKYHPDRNKNSKESEEKFKEVNEAYFILMNGGSTNQAFNSTGGPDIDSIFNKFRGMDFTKISQKLYSEARLFQKFFSEKHPDPNGCETQKLTVEDIVINANVDVRDIYYNLEKTFPVKRKVKCRDCMGLGTIINNIPCSDCEGSRYKEEKISLTIHPAERHHVFFKKGDEHISKYTGNIVVNVIKRFTENFAEITDINQEEIKILYINTLNDYDILVQIEKDKIGNIEKDFYIHVKILEQEKKKVLLSKTNQRVKIESMGFINPYKNFRGDLYIQVI